MPRAGLDSLGSVELVNVLSQRIGATLPATLTYNHPSIAAIASHLATLQPADPQSIHSQAAATAAAAQHDLHAVVTRDANEHLLGVETLAVQMGPEAMPLHMHNVQRLQGAVILGSSAVPLMGSEPGQDCLRLVPLQRWDVDALGSQQGEQSVRFGAFMEGLDLFDNSLFGCACCF